MKPRPAWWWGVQALAVAITAALVWRSLAGNWAEFRALRIAVSLHPGWIALSVLAILFSYACSVQAWRVILGGWNITVAPARSARIWLVANLGRYVPGKVWSVAGLIVLAQRAGVPAWAAGGSAVAIQAVAVGTAVAVVAAATPGAASPLGLAGAAAAAIATIAVLGSGRILATISRITRNTVSLRVLPVGAVSWSAAYGVVAWVAHGVSFWLLARGLGVSGSLSIVQAAGVFPLGYVVGLLALFAPGGLGVREVVLAGLLAEPLGWGGAVALSLASRIMLTILEIVTPLCVLLVTRGQEKQDVPA